MKIIVIILSLITSLYTIEMNGQEIVDSSFWEKIETNIIGSNPNEPKKLEEAIYGGIFRIDDDGKMYASSTNAGRFFRDNVLSSTDYGKTWLTIVNSRNYDPKIKYEPEGYVWSWGAKFISKNCKGKNNNCYIQSNDCINWDYLFSSEKNLDTIITDKSLNWKSVTKKMAKDIEYYDVDLRRRGFRKQCIYHANGNITIGDKIVTYEWSNSKGAFIRGGEKEVHAQYINIGEHGNIYQSCNGTFYYTSELSGLQNIICVSKDNESYKLLKTNLCEESSPWSTVVGERLEDIILFGDNIFVKGYEKNWRNKLKTSSLLFSENGTSWKVIGQNIETSEVRYNKKAKRYYLLAEGIGLFQSKKTYEGDCGTTVAEAPEEKKVTYGTTVITHGFQLGGEPPFKDKDWAFQMALEVLKNAENGTIYTYDKKTGNYDESITLADGKKGEKILLYDWASESNNSGLGYSEAAGDALFTSLLLGFKKEQFGLSNIHFIGHSRGTVVNTLASERLLVLKSNYPKSEYKDKILIDQVTNISPHDWGIAVSFDDIDAFDLKSVSNKQHVLAMSDLNDAHPDINIDEPIDYKPNNGVIAWKGLFNDTYLQEHGKLIEKKKWEKSISMEDLMDVVKTAMTTKRWPKIVWEGIKIYVKYNFNIEYTNLNDRRVAGSHNTLWADDEKGQYTLHAGERGVYNVYNKTIKGMPPLYGSGYQFSRLAKKKIQRPNDGYGLGIPTFDFYKNMNLKGKNNSRILGIMNGSFDRYSDIDAPGWSEHGGKMLGESNETTDNRGIKKGKPAFDFSNGYVTMNYLKSAKPMILGHNRFYVPIDAKNIGFKIKSQNLKDGILKVYINNGLVYEESIGTISNFIDKTLDESKFQIYRDKVVTLEFQFSGNPIQNNELPVLAIDEVKLIQGIPTNSSATTLNSTVEKLNTQNAQINKTQEATRIESTKIKENNTPSGRVKTKEGSDLMLRAEPSIKASIIAEIPNGTTINILKYDDKIIELNGEIGRWCKVDYDGKIGWAWEKFIETTISQEVVQMKSGYVKTKEGSDLRLRSAPSEKASIITKIANGSKVIILEKDDHFVTVNGDVGQWLKVKYEGTVGWAWGKFIIQN